ncbi:MAG: hypothetical protein FJ297_15170 [Planctomycetes bacterium]|nr:hypothetical protein [Planctomycetota bacterium]
MKAAPCTECENRLFGKKAELARIPGGCYKVLPPNGVWSHGRFLGLEREFEPTPMAHPTLPCLFRTLRHLRWSQVVARLRRTALRTLRLTDWPCPAIGSVDARSVRDDFPRMVRPSSRSTEALERSLAQWSDGVFEHLGRAESIGRHRPDWRLDDPKHDRLWTFTLHYHGWAHEMARIVGSKGKHADQAALLLHAYLGDWMERCAPRRIDPRSPAWNAYTVASRIVSWIRAYHGAGADPRLALPSFLPCLWRQARFLFHNIEWDLRANHLIRDAVGLAWAGRFFEGNEPRRWQARSDELAADQFREQILADGSHFERSPHYHVEVMRDCLDLACLTEDHGLATEWKRVWRAMAGYIAWLRHPDGSCPQFNDGGTCRPDGMHHDMPWAFESSPDARRPEGARHFPRAGIVVWHGTPWTVFFDVGPIGPDCQPGHGHADTLTVDASYGTDRLLIDAGCHGYDNDARRAFDRSTGAHNTVRIDGVDSSEMWGIFRVGRRARPINVGCDADVAGMRAEGSHDGYDFLNGAPRHGRSVRVRNHGSLEIDDRITGAGSHRIDGGWLLAPGWRASAVPGGWDVMNDGQAIHVRLASDQDIAPSVERRSVHPDYGVERTTCRLQWAYRGPLPLRVTTRFEPMAIRPGANAERADMVWNEPQAGGVERNPCTFSS